MRILVFTNLYPNNVMPNHGVFVKERMTRFARLAGNQVKVVAPVPYFPPLKINWRWKYSQVARQETIAGLEVYHPRFFMLPKIGMSLYGILMFLSALPVVIKLKRDFDFEVIDAHYVYPDGFAAMLLGFFFKRPVVVSARGSDINLFSRFPIIRKLLKLTLQKTAAAIAVCQALKDAMVKLNIPPAKIVVIPNGVDTGKFFPLPKQTARRQLGLPDDKIILSVGELIPRKGFHVLIQALALLIHEYGRQDVRLIIAGEGAYRKTLEELIVAQKLADHVRLAGAMPHAELHKWYSAADLFCLASDREGWPNVILESLACGTPVVATAIWGVPEILVSDEIGLLTKREARDLAEKLSLALDKSWQSHKIVSFARTHTWEKVARSVSNVFAGVLKQ
jgi:glycosyltransferase involved in cell wall biosynthesis